MRRDVAAFPRPAFAPLPSSGGSGTLQINAQGDIVSTQGAAHLSYLLGDVALLMIEKLPEANRDSWKVESSVTLAESGERLPGPPRGIQDPNRKKSAAD